MFNSIKVIGFDADDTLWVNEPYFQEVERQFCQIMSVYLDEAETSKELFKTEMQNLETYGYGAKAFILSMIETAHRVTNGKITSDEIKSICDIGKSLFTMPIELLDDVEEVLKELSGKYRLIVATKGDLLDQERKLQRSGLLSFFHHIEIMSDKQEANYQKLLNHLDIAPHEFLMVGNSVKSDILPVINLGGYAVHVPFEIMWQHEKNFEHDPAVNYKTLHSLRELPEILV